MGVGGSGDDDGCGGGESRIFCAFYSVRRAWRAFDMIRGKNNTCTSKKVARRVMCGTQTEEHDHEFFAGGRQRVFRGRGAYFPFALKSELSPERKNHFSSCQASPNLK